MVGKAGLDRYEINIVTLIVDVIITVRHWYISAQSQTCRQVSNLQVLNLNIRYI